MQTVLLVSFTLYITCSCIAALTVRNNLRKDCPCWDTELCKPISVKRSKEVFVYTVSRNGNWRNYRWDKITTISPVRFHDDALMCYAHSRNVSYVYFANGNLTMFRDPHLRALWVNDILTSMRDNFYDGATLDFENNIHPNDTSDTAALVESIKLLSVSAKAMNPNAQVTQCIAWTPNKAGRHAYGVNLTAPYLDFFYVRAYGEAQWGCLNCTTAEAGSSYRKDIIGLENYLAFGIPPSKLLLGFPWLGIDWTCLQYDAKNYTCWVKRTFDIWGNEVDRQWEHATIKTIWNELLPNSFTGRLWEESSKSPYFIYKDDNGTYHDVRYDDPESLQYKYDLVRKYKLRGTGMWDVDGLDYSNITMVDAFWEELPLYK